MPVDYDLSEFAPDISNKKSLKDEYYDFMQPKKVDEQGRPLVETAIGRLPSLENNPEFKFGSPENKKMINYMAEAGILSPGIAQIAEQPFKLTLKNIAQKIIDTKNKEKIFHTNEYNKIWDAAKKMGLDEVKFDPSKIDLQAIKNYTTKKYYGALEKFLDSPTLENAQKSQSDLGKLINSIESKTGAITSEENSTLNAAKNAQEHIKDSMFRDKQGNLNEALKNTYNKISESYGKNFIPYTNKAINAFQKGEMTAKELINRLKSGKFAAQKGASHPEINRRDIAIEALKYLGVPTSLGAGYSGGSYLIKKLLGQGENE